MTGPRSKMADRKQRKMLTMLNRKTEICHPYEQTRALQKLHEGPCINMQVHRCLAI